MLPAAIVVLGRAAAERQRQGRPPRAARADGVGVRPGRLRGAAHRRRADDRRVVAGAAAAAAGRPQRQLLRPRRQLADADPDAEPAEGARLRARRDAGLPAAHRRRVRGGDRRTGRRQRRLAARRRAGSTRSSPVGASGRTALLLDRSEEPRRAALQALLAGVDGDRRPHFVRYADDLAALSRAGRDRRRVGAGAAADRPGAAGDAAVRSCRATCAASTAQRSRRRCASARCSAT